MSLFYLDGIITLISLLSLLLLIKLRASGWQLALVASVFNFYLLLQTQLYANFILEIYFLITAVYGWMSWQQQPKATTKSVKTLSNYQWMWVLLSFISLSGLSMVLLQMTDSVTIKMDSITTALSIVAETLLALKFIETWLFWIIADVIYIALYYEKHLPFHIVLMACYCVLVVKGFHEWRAHLKAGRLSA